MKERVIRTMRRGIPILMICALLLGSAAKAADMNSAAKGMSVPAGTLAAYDSTDYENGEVMALLEVRNYGDEDTLANAALPFRRFFL